MLKQICRNDWCKQPFSVEDVDIEFYDKVSPVIAGKKFPIPAPTVCPFCRQLRRSAWRNERSLHPRECDKCQKRIVSVYSPDVPFPVYCNACWWSDSWEPRDYAQEYDPSRPFLEQYFEVNNRTPHISIMNDNGVTSQNCEYTQDFTMGKNCYMCAGGWYAEDCYYCGGNFLRVKSAVDSYFPIESELIYECQDSRSLYNCRYVRSSENCRDCSFGYDLKGCSDCFGCSGLRQKQFHWFNEPLAETDYKKRLSEFSFGSFAAIEDMKKKFEAAILALPRKGMTLVNCEDCSGDYLFNCQNVQDSYMVFNAQHSRFLDKGEGQVWSYDILHTGNSQFCYENLTPDNSYMEHFSMWCWVCKNILYSDNCQNSEDLFGCTSMKRAHHCVLNKQYSPEEYERVVSQIITQMQKTGEWAEPLPVKDSPFGYNETMAQDYMPLSEQEVKKRGWKWKQNDIEKKNGILAADLPDAITDVTDAVLQTPLICMKSGRPFKITKQELDFYRQNQIPLPRLHPDERHRNRFHLHNPPHIYSRQCMKCQTTVQTTYAPDRQEIVYCEKCYLETVY